MHSISSQDLTSPLDLIYSCKTYIVDKIYKKLFTYNSWRSRSPKYLDLKKLLLQTIGVYFTKAIFDCVCIYILFHFVAKSLNIVKDKIKIQHTYVVKKIIYL